MALAGFFIVTSTLALFRDEIRGLPPLLLLRIAAGACVAMVLASGGVAYVGAKAVLTGVPLRPLPDGHPALEHGRRHLAVRQGRGLLLFAALPFALGACGLGVFATAFGWRLLLGGPSGT